MSQFATVNDQRIISGNITIPYYGIWSANLVLATPAVIDPIISLTIANLKMKGKAYRMASFSGSRSVMVIGGNGGWRNDIQPQSYYNSNGLKKSLIIRDAASAVGETVVIDADSIVGNFYVREGNAPAERTLRDLAGDEWWIDNNGVTQVSTRKITTAITSQFDVSSWKGSSGSFQIATEDVAAWMPGRTFTSPTVTFSQKISMSSITVDNSGKLRIDVLTTGHANA